MTAEAFDWGEPISVYTREQAIEDGVIAAVPEAIAREAGFLIPVILTASVHGILERVSGGEDYSGRLWDTLRLAAWRWKAALAAGTAPDPCEYRLSFAGRSHAFQLTFSPTEGFMIGLPGED